MRAAGFRTSTLISVLVLAAACKPESPGNRPDAMPGADATVPDCDPAADDDGDCIPNGVEGCLQPAPPDRDNDGSPDYRDGDSDGDRLADELEAGPNCSDPRDTDGDGTPDYADVDSDNDSVEDTYEDRNFDGVIGTCTQPCAANDQCAPGAYCSVPLDGVGLGTCVSLSCTNGETDPHAPDTDGDGLRDALEGTSICNPTTPQNPFGLKPIKYVDSATTAFPSSNWRLALDVAAIETVPVISNAGPLDAAYMFDMIAPTAQVAGFLASRTSSTPTAGTEIASLVLNLEAVPQVTSVTMLASGNTTTTFDGFDTVLGATMEVTTSTQIDVTTMRELVTASALARPVSDVTYPDPGWTGVADNRFLVQVQSIRRANSLQSLFVGGVARRSATEDPTRTTVFHLNDMSNGSGIAQSGNGELIGCEQTVISKQAKADIIWILDESGSMGTLRQRVADNASTFFQKAVDAGLDFRIAVTDMNDASDGIFATRQAGGTGDRWLLPNELAKFEADALDPSGPDAADGGSEHPLTQLAATLNRHLPRNNADPQKFREDAAIVVILATDEAAQELKSAGIIGEGNVTPTMAQHAQIDAFVAPYLAQLANEDVTVHLIAEPLPYNTTASCTTVDAWGLYRLVDATSGQLANICQDDMSATLDVFIEDIIGSASPLTLNWVPISASVSTARDAVPLLRSRVNGFDYRGANNSVSFYNQFFSPAAPSEIVVSYRRWAQQGPVE